MSDTPLFSVTWIRTPFSLPSNSASFPLQTADVHMTPVGKVEMSLRNAEREVHVRADW